MPAVRKGQEFFEKISDVPNLFQILESEGGHPRGYQVKLVVVLGCVIGESSPTNERFYRMSMTDPIADLFTRILNAGRRGHETLLVPSSRMKMELLKIFRDEGYIQEFKPVVSGSHPTLEILLRYEPGRQKKSFISGIKRISKPGCRVYASSDEIPKVMNGLGLAILTTDRGILTDEQCRKSKVGGEVLCYVW